MANAILCRPLPFEIFNAANQTAGGPASNLKNDRLGRVWRMSGFSNAYVIFDLGFAQTIDVVALLAHNGQSADTMRVTAASDPAHLAGTIPVGPTLSNQVVSLQASSEAAKRIHRSALCRPTSVSARYWRIDVNTVVDGFTAGRLVIGKALEAADGVDIGWDFEVVDTGEVEQTPLGLDDIRLAAKVLRYRWTWSWLTEAEARGVLLDIGAYAGTTRPIFLCLDPGASDLHNVIGFGRLTEGYKGTNYAHGTYEASFSLLSKLILSL